MRHFRDSYGTVLRDYFYDFYRALRYDTDFIVILLFGLVFNWKIFDKTNPCAGLPVIFALISGAAHSLTLPFLMYLAPFSHEQREAYLQRSLYVKIAVPVLFALGVDFVLLFVRPLSLYVFLLQIAGVVMITYICGGIHDRGRLNGSTWRYAYGGFAAFADVSLVVCYLAGVVLTVACMGTVSAVEFWILFGVLALVTGPVVNGVRKHWREIRANFAEYEIAMQTKEVSR